MSSEFCRTFGKPLHRYLLELRITKAIGLLETGQYSVESVAEAVGFSDANYFSRYFKKITGKRQKHILNLYIKPIHRDTREPYIRPCRIFE